MVPKVSQGQNLLLGIAQPWDWLKMLKVCWRIQMLTRNLQNCLQIIRSTLVGKIDPHFPQQKCVICDHYTICVPNKLWFLSEKSRSRSDLVSLLVSLFICLFVHNLWSKWGSRMFKGGQRWPRVVKTGLPWTMIAKESYGWSKMVKNAQGCPRVFQSSSRIQAWVKHATSEIQEWFIWIPGSKPYHMFNKVDKERIYLARPMTHGLLQRTSGIKGKQLTVCTYSWQKQEHNDY